MTVGNLKRWYEENKVSDDTPIGIYIGDSERGAVAYGVIGDTEEVIDEKTFEPIRTELSSQHCY